MPTARLLETPRLSGAGNPDRKAFLINDYLFTLRQQILNLFLSILGRLDTAESDISTAQDNIDGLRSDTDANTDRLDDVSGLSKLTQSISSPPTQSEVQNIQNKVNDIIDKAKAST